MAKKRISLKRNGSGPVRPTLRDVAREAGVSLKTASRVLNNEPNVQENTARVVREAMARLDYHPNEMARSLKARRSSIIGVIAPVLSHEFVAGCVETLHRSLHQAGKTVMLMLSDGDPEAEQKHIRLMLRRQVEGLILFPAGGSRLKAMEEEMGDTPAVAIDNPSGVASMSSVTIANRRASREAMEHLLGHGYRRLGVIGARPELKTIRERVAGVREAIAAAGAQCDEVILSSEEELTVDVLIDLLRSRRNAPRAVLTLNSYASERVLHAAMRLGLRVPEDLALIGFDDFRTADLVSLGLTVVSQPVVAMGEAAVRLLLDRQAGRPTRSNVVLEAELIVRKTCGTKHRV